MAATKPKKAPPRMKNAIILLITISIILDDHAFLQEFRKSDCGDEGKYADEQHHDEQVGRLKHHRRQRNHAHEQDAEGIKRHKFVVQRRTFQHAVDHAEHGERQDDDREDDDDIKECIHGFATSLISFSNADFIFSISSSALLRSTPWMYMVE